MVICRRTNAEDLEVFYSRFDAEATKLKTNKGELVQSLQCRIENPKADVDEPKQFAQGQVVRFNSQHIRNLEKPG